MENLINKIKELETAQIIIFGVCFAAFIFLCYGIFFDGEEDARTISNSLELPEDGKAVTNFETKMDAYGVQEEKGSSIDLDFGEDFFSNDGDVRDSLDKMDRMKKLNDQIEQIESKKNEDQVYSEEDDMIIQELQKEIEKEKTVPRPRTEKTDYPKTPELTYEEKLRNAREARVRYIPKKEEEIPAEIFETKAVIYRDQFKLPGELVELALTEDFKYNDKIFKRGTLLYADLNIEKNRVLFNITNIAHIPMNIEVRDIRDGRVGMYSTKAGELWQKYESEALDDTANAVEQEIGAGTGSKIISTSINTISSFFKKKKLKENEKILLLNDQELIVHIKKEP
jgi:hypothetical protein